MGYDISFHLIDPRAAFPMDQRGAPAVVGEAPLNE